MTRLKSSTIAAMLIACASLASSAVSAASLGDCIQAAKQAHEALNANQQAPNYDQAKRAASDAQSFCASGLYERGVARYADVAKALSNKG